jgi:predicted RNase H-like HicB family nuclease
MQYQIKLKKSEEGYAVWCPSLLVCASQGETREEAIANIQGCDHILFRSFE